MRGVRLAPRWKGSSNMQTCNNQRRVKNGTKMRTGSAIGRLAGRPAARCGRRGGGEGGFTDEYVRRYRCRWCGVGPNQEAPETLKRRGAGAGKTPQEIVGQGQRSADNTVSKGGMARRPCLLLPLPVGVRITRGGISKLSFESTRRLKDGPRVSLVGCDRRGRGGFGYCRFRTSKTIPSSVVWSRPLPASSRIYAK